MSAFADLLGNLGGRPLGNGQFFMGGGSTDDTSMMEAQKRKEKDYPGKDIPEQVLEQLSPARRWARPAATAALSEQIDEERRRKQAASMLDAMQQQEEQRQMIGTQLAGVFGGGGAWPR